MTYSTQTKQYLVALCFVVLMALAITPAANAETSTATTTSIATTTTSNSKDISNLLALLQSLTKQVEDLKKKLAEVRGEIRTELKDGLKEGMTDEDIKKIQELLATDPTLYPKGLVTGYYGPMTKEAVLRFQARHELRTTGEVDPETKALILEYFKEGTNGQIPRGLLQAPGIDKKIKLRLITENGEVKIKCEDKKGSAFLCKEEFKEKHDNEGKNATSTNSDSSSTVESAIEKAEEAITSLEEAIDDATDEDAIEYAVDELGDAEALLSKATNELEYGKNRSAYDKAVKAKKIADAALEELDNNKATNRDAEDAIDDAKDAIDDLEEVKTDWEEKNNALISIYKLNKAHELLTQAEDAFDEKDYSLATKKAKQAEDEAREGIEELDV